ncbi:MAG TPA: hypothetical protein VF743_05620, partial [Acidimicrobiales bacterium]
VTACDGAAVTLEGGEHELAAAPGLDTGLDIDSLVLRSAAGGGPSDRTATLVAEATDARDPEAPAPAATPTVDVVDEGHDHVRVRVTGATADEPFWLVLGQSQNPGWVATLDGDALPEPELVDGFANGWRVVAPADTFEVDLRFAPQRRVDVALVLSVVGALGCLLLALRRPRPAGHFPSALPEPYSSVLAFRYEGALPTRGTALLTGLGMGVVSWIMVGPVVGLGVGIAAAVGARHETFRRWLLLASPVALALAGCYVLYIQVRHAPMPSFDWPIEMRRPHPLGWAAVLLLVADVVVDRVWQARRSDE